MYPLIKWLAAKSWKEEESLSGYAAELGLEEAFAACLLSGRNAEVVRADLEDGASYGVAGTPTFFVNGRRLEGAQPLAVMKRIIEQAERESD